MGEGYGWFGWWRNVGGGSTAESLAVRPEGAAGGQVARNALQISARCWWLATAREYSAFSIELMGYRFGAAGGGSGIDARRR